MNNPLTRFEKALNRTIGLIGWPLFGMTVASMLLGMSTPVLIVGAVLGLPLAIFVPRWIEQELERPDAD